MNKPVILEFTQAQWDYLYHLVNNVTDADSVEAYERAYEEGNIVLYSRMSLHAGVIGSIIKPVTMEHTLLHPERSHNIEDECNGR